MNGILNNSFIDSLVGIQGKLTGVDPECSRVVSNEKCPDCGYRCNGDCSGKAVSDDLYYRGKSWCYIYEWCIYS